MSRATSKRISTTTHLERCTDLLGGCTGLYLICCYLTVLQRGTTRGRAVQPAALGHSPAYQSSLTPHPSKHCCHAAPKSYAPLRPLHKSDCFTSVCLASVFFPQMYQRWKLSHLLTASVHTQIVWRNQMPKPLNINTHSTSQDIETCTTGECSPGDQEAGSKHHASNNRGKYLTYCGYKTGLQNLLQKEGLALTPRFSSPVARITPDPSFPNFEFWDSE